jgi:hypothetical protein
MLTIRADQMRALASHYFPRWMEAHLRWCFPARCAGRSSVGLQQLIQTGILKARTHGLAADADVCRFIDMMLVLGESFDSDSALPWASAVLQDDRFTNPSARLEMLHDCACDYLRTGTATFPPAQEAETGDPVEDLEEDIIDETSGSEAAEPEPDDDADDDDDEVDDDDEDDDDEDDDDDDDNPAEAGNAGGGDPPWPERATNA